MAPYFPGPGSFLCPFFSLFFIFQKNELVFASISCQGKLKRFTPCPSFSLILSTLDRLMTGPDTSLHATIITTLYICIISVYIGAYVMS